jgi:membrane fusion protein, heavy metal efflux system
MNSIRLYSCLFVLAVSVGAEEVPRNENTVVLDEVAVANLGLMTEEVGQETFETTLMILGEIDHTCMSHSVVSSRVAGRIVEVGAHLGEFVEEGQLVAQVESRQPGNPPPVIELRAPAAGLVIRSEAHLGAPVDPEKALLEIHDLSTVWVVARVPQHHGPLLVEGLEARVNVPALGQQFQASFGRLGPTADADAGTLQAIFELPNPNNLLRPGMRAELMLVTGRREGVFSIPRDALQGDRLDRFVFIRDYELDHAFVRTPVTIGMVDGMRVEILSGLLPGDEVVTHGAYGLAFAGRGNASLKEALDAAHGHPHNEDGSEMSAEQIAAGGEMGHHDHGHDHGHGHGLTVFLGVTSAVLFLLLLASPFVFRNRRLA